jgi:hypothetical protein
MYGVCVCVAQVFSVRGDGRLFANSIQVDELIHLSDSHFGSFTATTGGGTILGGGLTVSTQVAMRPPVRARVFYGCARELLRISTCLHAFFTPPHP